MQMEEKGTGRDGYEALFLDLCKRVEKLLLRLIAGALVLLLAAQALLQIPLVRGWISRVDKLEGVPYKLPDAQAATGSAETEKGIARK